MSQIDYTVDNRKNKHLTERERYTIEILLKEKYPLYSFTLKLSRTTTTNKVTISIPDYKEDNPMDANKVYNHFKIYKPLADKYTKWRNNLTELDIQGFKQLPKTGDILIITKSMKDVMCLYEMGIPAISPSSESTFIPNKILEQLKKRFKRIIILFDRDEAGVKYLRKISLKTGLEGMLVHKKFKAKDISDAIKANGFEKVKNWLTKQL